MEEQDYFEDVLGWAKKAGRVDWWEFHDGGPKDAYLEVGATGGGYWRLSLREVGPFVNGLDLGLTGM